MEIYFKNTGLQKDCNSFKRSIKCWGPDLAKKLHQRLFELNAAENLSEISQLPPPRCHELSNSLKHHFAVDVKQPFRLIFCPQKPIPMKEDGGVDLIKVTSIIILSVEDYHE